MRAPSEANWTFKPSVTWVSTTTAAAIRAMAAAQLIHAWCAGWQKSTTESHPFKARPEVLVVTEWHRHSSTVPRRRCGQRSESRWSPAEQKSLCWGGVACGRHAMGSVCLKMCTRSAGYGQTLCQCTLLCNRCDSSDCFFFFFPGRDLIVPPTEACFDVPCKLVL